MIRHDIRCEDLHVNEVAYQNFAARDEAFEAGVACPDCGKPVERIILKVGEIIYNAPGFYGNIPTDLAHNTGQV